MKNKLKKRINRLEARIEQLEKRMNEVAPVKRTVDMKYEPDGYTNELTRDDFRKPVLGNDPPYDNSMLMDAIKNVSGDKETGRYKLKPDSLVTKTEEAFLLSQLLEKDVRLEIRCADVILTSMFEFKDDLLKAIITVYENRK